MPKKLSAEWRARHQRWRRFVEANIRAMEGGASIRLGPSPKPLMAPPAKATKGTDLSVVVCSPHPDDEALTGALPLRLRQEIGARVIDFAITLGSAVGRRARRMRELIASCEVLGFDYIVLNPRRGFEHVNLKNRKNRPREWVEKVHLLSEALERENPDAIFAPHREDFHSTHIGTHFLVVDAVRRYLERSGRGPLPFFETEYWRQHARPNLMVGLSPADEATLVMAIAEHGGEVRRNSYHLRHPARMIENVRRGAEVVGGHGRAAPNFAFAELYRLAFLTPKGLVEPLFGSRMLAPAEKINWQQLVRKFGPEKLVHVDQSPTEDR